MIKEIKKETEDNISLKRERINDAFGVKRRSIEDKEDVFAMTAADSTKVSTKIVIERQGHKTKAIDLASMFNGT